MKTKRTCLICRDIFFIENTSPKNICGICRKENPFCIDNKWADMYLMSDCPKTIYEMDLEDYKAGVYEY